MHLFPLPLSLLLLSLVSASQHPARKSYDTHDYYVLEHNPGHNLTPEQCAKHHGLELIEPLGELPNHWVLGGRKGFEPTYVRRDLSIKSLEKQLVTRLQKRQHTSNQRYSRALSPLRQNSSTVAHRLEIEDPLFPEQWHIINDQQPQHTLNVVPVWELGYTGAGVTIAMVDDGVDYESTDLAENFDFEGSWDFNTQQALPKPLLAEDTHGTRCAGQIVASKNHVCGIGIAYKSRIAGLRILSGHISPIDEAIALNYHFNTTDIYSCSWGPHDDGATLGDVYELSRKAILNGASNGRGGKGSIFVFSSGNGGGADDMCGFDGYNNAIWTVTIGSVNDGGWAPVYSEGCSAMMAVTYSSGSRRHRDITTTDVGRSKCTSEHGGTSAAAPFASGIFALALSARPDLTWRDIQHLIYHTAELVDPTDSSWETTSSSLGAKYYSYQYGWGKLDAMAYVSAALEWKLVKPQTWVRSGIVRNLNNQRLSENGVQSTFTVTEDLLKTNNFDNLGLEHVTVRVWITAEIRGRIQVALKSPRGVVSLLGKPRPKDLSDSGFDGWMFMSVKHWAEDPIGTWTLIVSDPAIQTNEELIPEALFQGWSITLFGSCVDPNKAIPYTLEYDTDMKDWGSPQAAEATHLTTRLPRPSFPTQLESPSQAVPSLHAVAIGGTSSFFDMRHFSVIVMLCGILIAGMVTALCIWSKQRLKRGTEIRYQLVEVRHDGEEDA